MKQQMRKILPQCCLSSSFTNKWKRITLDNCWEHQSVIEKKKSHFLPDNLHSIHSNFHGIIGLQHPSALEKWTCLYFLVEIFPFHSLVGGYSNSGKMNQFYISEYSSRNSEISEINKAEFVLQFLQKKMLIYCCEINVQTLLRTTYTLHPNNRKNR